MQRIACYSPFNIIRYVGLVLVPVWRAGCAGPAGRWITGVPSFMKRPEVQPEPCFR
jgi:hypothetical protein